MMCYRHILACLTRDRLTALEACPGWKGGGISSSSKPLVFLRRNLPELHSRSAEGGMDKRISLVISLWNCIFHITSSHLFYIKILLAIVFLCVPRSIVWKEEEGQKFHLFCDF